VPPGGEPGLDAVLLEDVPGALFPEERLHQRPEERVASPEPARLEVDPCGRVQGDALQAREAGGEPEGVRIEEAGLHGVWKEARGTPVQPTQPHAAAPTSTPANPNKRVTEVSNTSSNPSGSSAPAGRGGQGTGITRGFIASARAEEGLEPEHRRAGEA